MSADIDAAGGTGTKHRGRVRLERSRKRIRTYVDGHVVADTIRPLLVWEGHTPTYYIPTGDVAAELVATGATDRSPSRGTADIFDVVVASRSLPGAARRFADSPFEDLRDAVRLDWAAMDEWLEEDEPIYTHPRDPYSRVDILASSRHVQVVVDGVRLADSRSPKILYETGLPPRYYLPLPDLRTDLMHPTSTVTHCPYKGQATYWSVRVGERTYDDLVWMYRAPLPESTKIAGLGCFYNERVELYVDGVLQENAGS
jgi:uncharacterized protein (DUF427 family)